MAGRKYNQGRVTDYSGADMADPVQRAKGDGGLHWAHRLEDDAGAAVRDGTLPAASPSSKSANQVKQASRGTTAGQSPGHSGRPSAPADGSESEPLTLAQRLEALV
jgi:hypothetical protein